MNKARMCPKCNSIDTTIDRSSTATLGITQVAYTCNKCGFTGLFFPEVDLEDDENKV